MLWLTATANPSSLAGRAPQSLSVMEAELNFSSPKLRNRLAYLIHVGGSGGGKGSAGHGGEG